MYLFIIIKSLQLIIHTIYCTHIVIILYIYYIYFSVFYGATYLRDFVSPGYPYFLVTLKTGGRGDKDSATTTNRNGDN